MQWGPMGQFLNKGPDTMAYSTVSVGSIYGPTSGDSTSTNASKNGVQRNFGRFTVGHLSLPTLIVLGILVWWALHEYD